MSKMLVWNPWAMSPSSFWDEEDEFTNIKLDLYEDGDNLILEVEAPGFKKGDFDIKFESNFVTVSANKKEEKKEEDKKRRYYRREISTISFTRTVELPYQVQARKAEAKYEDGVLKVILPKSEEAKPTKITVS